jgi:hypothetical protein
MLAREHRNDPALAVPQARTRSQAATCARRVRFLNFAVGNGRRERGRGGSDAQQAYEGRRSHGLRRLRALSFPEIQASDDRRRCRWTRSRAWRARN